MVGIIVCTSACNLSCKYCYEHIGRDRCWKKRSEVDELFIEEKKNILNYTSEVVALAKGMGRSSQIILHGGEPLLLNEGTLGKFLNELKGSGCNHIQIQTNGTMITPSVADAIKKCGASVVISLDGPAHIHDANRVNFLEDGTFDRVYKSVLLLQQKGIQVSALATITTESYDKANEIYTFFNDTNLEFSVNRCFPVRVKEGYAVEGLEENAYRQFLSDLFDLYTARSTGDVQVSCFERCLHDLISVPSGYVYTPKVSPSISLYDVESRVFKYVGVNNVSTHKEIEDLLLAIMENKDQNILNNLKRYTGTIKECLIEHLCWQQLNDYNAALEVNT